LVTLTLPCKLRIRIYSFDLFLSFLAKKLLFINKYLPIFALLKTVKMKIRTEQVLTFLKIVAWLAFVGYAIKAGTQTVGLVVGFIDPAFSEKLYEVNTLFLKLRQYNVQYFVNAMSLLVFLSAFKAHVRYLVIQLLSKLRLQTPFSRDIAQRLEKIAFELLGIWLVNIMGMAYLNWLEKTTGEQLGDLGVGDEFLLFAAIVYIVAQIFKRGIELKEESELTV
jgi:hypothetical protein